MTDSAPTAVAPELPAAANGHAAEAPGLPHFPVETFREAAPHLRRPFTVAAVKFKPQQKLANRTTLCVAYLDARLVIERLNLVVADGWKAEYEPVPGGLMWCHLTVGGVTRRDVGQGQGKALVSDSLKRAAVHFGIGVSLYAAPAMYLPGDVRFLNETHLLQLRGNYKAWLEQRGSHDFGDPLDHGDVEDAQGDADAPEATGEVTPEAIDDAISDESINRARAKELVDFAFAIGVQTKLQLAASHTAGGDVGDCSTKAKATTALQKLTIEQADRVGQWLQRKADEATAADEGAPTE